MSVGIIEQEVGFLRRADRKDNPTLSTEFYEYSREIIKAYATKLAGSTLGDSYAEASPEEAGCEGQRILRSIDRQSKGTKGYLESS